MKQDAVQASAPSSTACQKEGGAFSVLLFGWLFRLLSPPAAPPPPPPRKNDQADTACRPSNSSPTPRATSALERVFHDFDENGDGRISPSELQRCMRALGEELSEEDARAMVAATDSDGDGLMGFEDFRLLAEAEGEEEGRSSLREAFRAYEMEGQGCITPRSLHGTLGRLGEARSLEECTLMIRCFDLNGDGVLSFDEFTAMMLSDGASDTPGRVDQ